MRDKYKSKSRLRQRQRIALRKYKDALSSMPPAGEGAGCHTHLLRAGNYARLADVSREKAFDDIKAIVTGSRPVSDRELNDALNRAFSIDILTSLSESRSGKTASNLTGRVERFYSDIVQTNLAQLLQGKTLTQKEVIQRSPLKFKDKMRAQAISLLSNLFLQDDHIFMGGSKEPGVINHTVRKRDEWINLIERGLEVPSHLIANPILKSGGLTKGGRESLRCDSSISERRFAIVEFDSIPREQQLAFFFEADLPIVAIVSSGNKSFHGWIDVRVGGKGLSEQEWQKFVLQNLRSKTASYGADPCTFNPSRLTRMPGHKRQDTLRDQYWIYLSNLTVK